MNKRLPFLIIMLLVSLTSTSFAGAATELPDFDDRGEEYYGIYLDGEKIGYSSVHEYLGKYEGRKVLIMESTLDVTFPWGAQKEHLVSTGREIVDLKLNLLYLEEEFESSVRGPKSKTGKLVDDAFELRTHIKDNTESLRTFDAESLTSLGALVHAVRIEGFELGGKVPLKFLDLDMYDDNDKIEEVTVRVQDKKFFEQIEGDVFYLKVPTTGSSLPFNFKVWSSADGEIYRQVFDYKPEFTSSMGPWQMTFIKEKPQKAMGADGK